MATLNEAGGTRNAPTSSGTIYAAVEVSRKSWTVALHTPDAGRIGLHTVPATDTAALAGLIDRARDALECGHGPRPRVLCGYEAGYEGFWLARRLARLGVEPLVLDPASLPASRKARRPKTDRLDAAGMVRALMAFDHGEPLAPGTVRVPSVEEEDRRRLLRERRRLVKQRTMLANSVKGLLMLHGVFDLDPRKRDFAERLDAARTGYGTPLPPGLRAEVRRTATLLAVVEGQIAEVEAERDRIVARAVAGAARGIVKRTQSGETPEGDGEKRVRSGATPEDDGEMRAVSGAAPVVDGGTRAKSGTAPEDDGEKRVRSGTTSVGDGGKRVRSGAGPEGNGEKRARFGAAPEDSGEPGTMIARLIGLRGVGANDAVLLVREVFCRGFRNRRELAGWAGLAPAPWASGEVVRSQGIDKAGPPWLRAQMLQLAWRWLRHQPESALSQWFRARAGTSGGRMRRVFVVALARKLLVALWRYATTGLAPDGAALA